MIDLIERIGPYLGIVAFLGLAILAFLIFQQAREVRRLREWAGRAPERADEAAEASLAAAEAGGVGAGAVGGLTMGADPVACAALAGGARVDAFFVRKDRKAHGLQRWIEGPPLAAGERCLIVEDVVTTGGSTVTAIERVKEEGLGVVGVMSVLDRLAGGREAIESAAGAPYTALATIDDVYPERPA